MGNYYITVYDEAYRDDAIFCIMLSRDDMGRAPRLSDEMLNVHQEYMARGDMFWLAVDDDNRVVGTMGVRSSGPGEVWLRHLYVKPGHKRQGIGTALLAMAEQHALSKGAHTMHARFADICKAAPLFCAARGFDAVPLGDGLEHMQKHLKY